MKSMNHRVKHLDIWDIQLIKLAIVAFVLMALKMWPAIMTWVYRTNIWLFFAALIIFGARPFYRCWVMD